MIQIKFNRIGFDGAILTVYIRILWILNGSNSGSIELNKFMKLYRIMNNENLKIICIWLQYNFV